METVKMNVAENLSVVVTPDKEFEFVMTTSEVAKGYGISASRLRSAKFDYKNELVEGKHFITSVQKMDAGCKSGGYLQSNQTLWTKRGIVRLGFFIKSERAKMFRDWAEDLVINAMDDAQRVTEQAQQLDLFPEVPKRNHNRLSKDRLVDILVDVARIEDKTLRLSLIDKLTNH